MNNMIHNFWSIVSQQKLYNYSEIIASLVRQNDTDPWKVTYMRIELLMNDKEKENVVDYQTEKLRIIRNTCDIGILDNLSDEISRWDTVTINDEKYSLELIQPKFTYELLKRTTINEIHGIDYPCRALTASGNS
jgi:hypothetical protein